jgi:hypothetical protein
MGWIFAKSLEWICKKCFNRYSILNREDVFCPINFFSYKIAIFIKPDDPRFKPLYPVYKKYFDILDKYLQK